MKLTIFAATGGVGRELLEQAAAADHDRDSRVDWTVVRPPRLTGKALTGAYRTAYEQNLRGGTSVPRADVAHLMLRVLGRPETIGHAIGIAS